MLPLTTFFGQSNRTILECLGILLALLRVCLCHRQALSYWLVRFFQADPYVRATHCNNRTNIVLTLS